MVNRSQTQKMAESLKIKDLQIHSDIQPLKAERFLKSTLEYMEPFRGT